METGIITMHERRLNIIDNVKYWAKEQGLELTAQQVSAIAKAIQAGNTDFLD